MAKRGRKPKTEKATDATVLTFPGNGAPASTGVVGIPIPTEKIPIGEAMRQAVEALGEVVVDDSLAPQQLRQLAETHADVIRRKAAWEAKAEEAKIAKKSLESATELLLEQVRTFTRQEPLPLFDAAQREADQAAMEAPMSARDVDDLDRDLERKEEQEVADSNRPENAAF